MQQLNFIAEKFKLAVVVTNQVTTVFREGTTTTLSREPLLKGWLGTINLLIKMGCFVKKSVVKILFGWIFDIVFQASSYLQVI